MPDHEGVVTGTLGFERIADGLRGAAEFCQRMKQVIGRIEAMDLELDAWTGHGIQKVLQSPDIWSLLDWMNEALVPQPGGT
jgi:hypothetical protein